MLYFFYIIVSFLWCLGLFVSTFEGMVLYRTSLFLEKKLPVWIAKPMITCVACMSSFHTFLIMLIGHFLVGVQFVSIKQALGVYLLAVPSVAFLNTFFWTYLNRILSGESDRNSGIVLETDVSGAE